MYQSKSYNNIPKELFVNSFVAMFQHSLFLRITTLLSWLKSTLLLKNKCFDTHIYMKTQCLQTKWDAA